MIILHNIKGTAFAVNAGLIERVEGDTETHITLVTGTSYVVQESIDKVVELHRDDRARVQAQVGLNYAQNAVAAECDCEEGVSPSLHLVAHGEALKDGLVQ